MRQRSALTYSRPVHAPTASVSTRAEVSTAAQVSCAKAARVGSNEVAPVAPLANATRTAGTASTTAAPAKSATAASGEGPDPSATGGVGNDNGGLGGNPNTIEAEGCSCRTAAGSDGVKAALLALAGLTLLAARRRNHAP